MSGLDKPEEATEPEATKPITEVSALMREYFVLKDQMKRLKVARSEFMGMYECTNMKPGGYMEPDESCVQRGWGGQLEADACEPCKRRHWFYTERKKNAHRRSSIMRQARHQLGVIGLVNKSREDKWGDL